jgi:integrase
MLRLRMFLVAAGYEGSTSKRRRAATRYKLANDGIDTRALQAYLGHRNIQNTTRYTALAPGRFKRSRACGRRQNQRARILRLSLSADVSV